jgi:DNA-binding NarL/FixJ family response regulator
MTRPVVPALDRRSIAALPATRWAAESEHAMAVKVVIADDHEVVRRGLVSLLAGNEVTIVGQAASGDEAVKVAKKSKPQVILLDVRMPGSDGLAALEKIRAQMPGVKCVMLSTFDNPTYVARAVAAGAHDYVLKGCTRAELIRSITAAAAGEAPARLGELRRVATTMANRANVPDPDVPLTARETQVLRHMALGLSNKEIAQSLTISVETVKEHVQNVLRKLAVSDRTQAAVWAVRRGIV